MIRDKHAVVAVNLFWSARFALLLLKRKALLATK